MFQYTQLARERTVNALYVGSNPTTGAIRITFSPMEEVTGLK